MNPTDQALHEARLRLHQAQGVQQARFDAERSEQDEINRAAADVEQLARKARREQFNAAVAQLTANRDAIHASYRELITALLQGEVRKAIDIKQQLDAAVDTYNQQREDALKIVAVDIHTDGSKLAEQYPYQRSASSDADAYSQAVWTYAQKLPTAELPIKSIADWVYQAHDPLERQIRYGLAFAVTGQWL